MNNDKLLRAFIEASGFEIEESSTTAGDLIDNGKSSALYSTIEIKRLYPNKHVETECFGGNWVVSEPTASYKVTKKNVKQPKEDLIIEMCQEIFKHSEKIKSSVTEIALDGLRVTFNKESESLSINSKLSAQDIISIMEYSDIDLQDIDMAFNWRK